MKINIIFLFCGLLCFTFSVLSYSQANNTDDLQKVKSLFNDGLYQEVISLCLTKDQGDLNTETIYYLGLSYNAMQNFKPAKKCFEEIATREPQKIKYIMQLAKVLTQLGQTEEAAKNYYGLLSIDSTYIPALFELGNIHFENREWNTSYSVFKRILELDSISVAANYYAAHSLYNKKGSSEDTALVKHYLTVCFYHNDDYIPALDLLGNVYYNENNFSFALAFFKKASEVTGNNPYFFYRTGLCYEKRADYKTSSKYFIQAVKLDSNVAKYHEHLGFSHYNLGNLDSAIIHYIKATELDKNNINCYVDLGLTYMKAKKYDSALASFNNALQIFPINRFTGIYEKIATVYKMQNNNEEAINWCQKTLLYDPENTTALFALGYIYDEQKNYKTAVKYYSAALPLFEANPLETEKAAFVKKRLEELKVK